MTANEWLVVLGGLGLGYLVVSMLMGGKPVRKAKPAPSDEKPPEAPQASAEGQQADATKAEAPESKGREP